MPHQTYLVTGANRGIGLELVRQLAARPDSRVIGTARSPAAAKELASLARSVVKLDVADESSIASLGDQLEAGAIDVLINNAGIGSDATRSLATLDAAEMRRSFDVNAIAPALVAKAVLPRLRAGRRKLIVNVTSQLGSITNNTGGSSYGYRASKAALNMLTVCMSNELKGEGFTCIAMHPGWVRTDMGGKDATLSVQESAGMMLRTIDALRAEDTGRYLNYDGTGLPW